LTTGGVDTTGIQNPVVDTEALKAACGAEDSQNATDAVDLKECKALCEQGTCCYTKDWCSVPNPEQFCANFGYCDKIIEDDGDDDGLDDDKNNDDANLEDFADITTDTGGGADDLSTIDKKTIDAACAGTGETEMCKELCDEAKCCFLTEGCDTNHPPVHCTNFIACLKFHVEIDYSKSDVAPSSDSTALQAACADNNKVVEVPGQPSLCETLCAHGDCCFKHEGCSTEDLIRYWSMDDPKQFCAPYGVRQKFHT
jgi:hypothetical protein